MVYVLDTCRSTPPARLAGRLPAIADPGAQTLVEPQALWEFTLRADTACTVLSLPRQAFQEVAEQSEALRAHLDQVRARPQPAQNEHGEADVALSAGHSGESQLPGAFVDYELAPREYELSVAQTVLRVQSRVADLYNDPMNQVQQQLRLTIEALRERQEHELVNNRDFGLLHNADAAQRIQTRSGPPTPADFDDLLSRRRGTRLFLAHPKAIAAFGRECNSRGIYPESVEAGGRPVRAWRASRPSRATRSRSPTSVSRRSSRYALARTTRE